MTTSYSVIATRETTNGAWTAVRQIPTITVSAYHAACHTTDGIPSTEGAERYALNLFRQVNDDPNTTFHVHAEEVDQ